LQLQPLIFSQLTLLAQLPKHLHHMLSLKLTMSRQGQVAQGKMPDPLAHTLLVDFNYIAKTGLLFVIYLFNSSLYLFVMFIHLVMSQCLLTKNIKILYSNNSVTCYFLKFASSRYLLKETSRAKGQVVIFFNKLLFFVQFSKLV
jgi:hypothetical protein